MGHSDRAARVLLWVGAIAAKLLALRAPTLPEAVRLFDGATAGNNHINIPLGNPDTIRERISGPEQPRLTGVRINVEAAVVSDPRGYVKAAGVVRGNPETRQIWESLERSMVT